jgi:molybdopterin molybdotransferase
VEECEPVRLEQALGRILATDVVAQRPVPAFDNAGVDGLAFAWAPAMADGGRLVLEPGRSAAGHGFPHHVPAGHAVRILTGAPLPDGTDTVAPIERCRVEEDHVHVLAGLVHGANRRLKAEDVAAGARLITAGTRLDPRHIAVAASLGLDQLVVYRRLRVALFSTGDELLRVGDPWQEGRVYDANRPLLAAMLRDLPVDLVDCGIVRDDRASVAALLDGQADVDVVLSTGGASRGDEDHVASQLAERGWLDFWRVALRPGRPLAMGANSTTVFIALPGNPVAAALAFLRFARPLLLGRAGAGWHLPARQEIRTGTRLERRSHRTELIRCRLSQSDDAHPVLHPVAREGSGLLTTLLEADGVAEIEAGDGSILPGEPVPYLSWQALGLNC